MSPPRKRPRTQPISAKRPPPPPRQTRSRPAPQDENSRPRTLVDLLGRSSSRAEQVLGDNAPSDAWSVLANTLDNLPSESRQNSTHSHQPAPPSAPDLQEPSNEHLPLDLSIKTAITVISSRSLAWTTIRGQAEEYEALRDLLSDVDALVDAEPTKPPLGTDAVAHSHPPSEPFIRAKRLFYRALLHFRYPCTTLPPVISRRWQSVFNPTSRATPDSALQEATHVAMERLRLWQSALQSLFFGYKRGHIDHFYVILPSTALLFSHAVVHNQPRPVRNGRSHHRRGTHSHSTTELTLRACFAKGSPGLRSLLSDYAVPFKIEHGSDRTGGETDPCVVAEGVLAVQAVYNFALAVGHKISNATDVPILLCDKPFRGGTAMSAQVTDVDETNVIDSHGGPTRLRYSVKVNGLLTPRQLTAICKAFVATQDHDYSVQLKTEPRSEMLNVSEHLIGQLNNIASGNSYQPPSTRVQGRRVLSRIVAAAGSRNFSLYTRAVE